MAKTNTAGADQAPATLEEAVALAQSYKEKLEATDAALEAAGKEAEKSEKTIADLKSELADAAEVISDLKTQAASAGTGKSKRPVVKINKQEYLIVGGTVIKQKAYKPEDIAADKQLCEKLIEKGSTLLVKLT